MRQLDPVSLECAACKKLDKNAEHQCMMCICPRKGWQNEEWADESQPLAASPPAELPVVAEQMSAATAAAAAVLAHAPAHIAASLASVQSVLAAAREESSASDSAVPPAAAAAAVSAVITALGDAQTVYAAAAADGPVPMDLEKQSTGSSGSLGVKDAAAEPAAASASAASAAKLHSHASPPPPQIQVKIIETDGSACQCFYHAVGDALGYKRSREVAWRMGDVMGWEWSEMRSVIQTALQRVQYVPVLNNYGFDAGVTLEQTQSWYLESGDFQRQTWGGNKEMHLLSLGHDCKIQFRTFADTTSGQIDVRVIAAGDADDKPEDQRGDGTGRRKGKPSPPSARAEHQVLLYHCNMAGAGKPNHYRLIVLTVNGEEYLTWPLVNPPLDQAQLQQAVIKHLQELRRRSSSGGSPSPSLHPPPLADDAAGDAPRKRKSARLEGVADADAGAAAAAEPAEESAPETKLKRAKLVEPMRDSTHLWEQQQYAQLRALLQQDGYLFVRRALSDKVDSARICFFNDLLQKKSKMCTSNATSKEPTASLSKKSTAPKAFAWDALTGVESHSGEVDWQAQQVGRSESMRALYSEGMQRFAETLFASSSERRGQAAEQPAASAVPFVLLPQCTWMRALRVGGKTHAHSDIGFFLRRTDHLRQLYDKNHAFREQHAQQADAALPSCGFTECSMGADVVPTHRCIRCLRLFHAPCQVSLRLWLGARPQLEMSRWHCDECLNAPSFEFMFTCWTPLLDLTAQSSRLQVLPASHRQLQAGYECPLSDDDGDILPAGYSTAAAQDEWRTAPADMRAGDVILFNAKLIHAATPHAEKHLRLSLDTRMAALLPHSPPVGAQPEAREEQGEAVHMTDEVR